MVLIVVQPMALGPGTGEIRDKVGFGHCGTTSLKQSRGAGGQDLIGAQGFIVVHLKNRQKCIHI